MPGKFYIAVFAVVCLASCGKRHNQEGQGPLLKPGVWAQSNGTHKGIFYTLTGSPTDPSTLYAGISRGGIIRTNDSGATWKTINIGLPALEVRSLAVDPKNPSALYAAVPGDGGGLFRSTNGGEAWSGINDALPTKQVTAVAYNPNSIVVGVKVVAQNEKNTLTWEAFSGAVAYEIDRTPDPDPLRVVPGPADQSPPTSFLDPGLTNGTEYFYTITALFSDGAAAEASSEVGGMPTDSSPTVTPQPSISPGNGQNRLSWPAVTGALSYNLYRREGREGTQCPLPADLEGLKAAQPAPRPLNTAQATDGGLENGTRYCYRVTALFKNNDEKEPSGEVSATPKAPSTLYAGTSKNGIFVSGAAGDFRSPANGSEGGALGNLEIRALLIDPADSRALYAGTMGGLYRGVRQPNGTMTWSQIFTRRGVFSLAADLKAAPPPVYAGTSSGVFRADGREEGLSGQAVTAVAVAPDGGLLAGTPNRGLFRRPLGGSGFEAVSVPFVDIRSFAVTSTGPGGGVVWAGTPGEIWRSEDSGLTWSSAQAAVPDTSGVNLLAASDVFHLEHDPKNPDIVYAATLAGVFKSVDRGARWEAINLGLPGSAIFAIAVHPLSTEILFAGSSQEGIFISRDGGGLWQLLPNPYSRFIWSIVSSPDGSVFYAGSSGSGVLKSSDGGANWSPTRGIDGTSVLVLTPVPGRSDLLFAGTSANGVYALAEGPKKPQFTLSYKGSESARVTVDLKSLRTSGSSVLCALEISLSEFGTIRSLVDFINNFGGCYSATLDPSADGTERPGNLDYLLEADLTGAGVTLASSNLWTPVAPMVKMVNGVVQWSTNVLALAAGSGGALLAGTSVGIFRSGDEGRSWEESDLSFVIDTKTLAFDPLDPRVSYAGTSEGIYRSSDGGLTWSSFDSLEISFSVILSISVDPRDGGILLGTKAGGVFRRVA